MNSFLLVWWNPPPEGRKTSSMNSTFCLSLETALAERLWLYQNGAHHVSLKEYPL